MPNDALDPGEDGTYPHWPRRPDGSPDPERMPTGLHKQRIPRTNRRVVVDLTMRDPDGNPINPPTIPPGGEDE
jgi:hypothetical protein